MGKTANSVMSSAMSTTMRDTLSMDAVLVALLRPLLRKAICTTLESKVGEHAARGVYADAMAGGGESFRAAAPEATVGGRVLVRLAALTAALFRGLVQRGLSDTEARELTAEITWHIYRSLNRWSWLATRLRSKDPLARVKAMMDLSFKRFPYSPPDYRMNYAQCDDQTVGFDVHRCPVAQYFKREGLSELCGATFCDLDFPLAQQWGLELQRPHTLAAGDDHCDFRFHRRS